MKRAMIPCAALAGCGGAKSAPPDAAAICRGTQEPRDAIVLRTSESHAGGKARGLREVAARSEAGAATLDFAPGTATTPPPTLGALRTALDAALVHH